MTDLKSYYQVKWILLRCKIHFLHNPPKTEDEKYVYEIICKAYWINEKKIDMFDFKKNKKILENYYEYLIKKESKDEKH